MTQLEVRNLCKTYDLPGGPLQAVQPLSFTLEPGARLGIVGESGSGKSTLARMIAQLETPSGGEILLDGIPLRPRRYRDRRAIYQKIQLIFQNPQTSFDPRQTLRTGLREAAINWGAPRGAADEKIAALLAQVGLDPVLLARYPHEVSGGQCQRAAIARALLASPSLLLCDEVTSALDVSVGGQILDLLDALCQDGGPSLLFISHDLAAVQRLCPRAIVMQGGRVVEEGPVAQLLDAPRDAYTRQLVDAARGFCR